MVKSRSTVRWVTDKVADICARHVSAIYTGRAYSKFTRERLSILCSDFRIANVRFFRYNSLHFHKLTTNVNFYVFSMKILNKLADADVVVGSCNLLNDR